MCEFKRIKKKKKNVSVTINAITYYNIILCNTVVGVMVVGRYDNKARPCNNRCAQHVVRFRKVSGMLLSWYLTIFFFVLKCISYSNLNRIMRTKSDIIYENMGYRIIFGLNELYFFFRRDYSSSRAISSWNNVN